MSSSVDPAVKEAVLAWGRSPNLDAGVESLARSQRVLPRSLIEELYREVAAVSVEALMSAIAVADEAYGPSTENRGQTLEFAGLQLSYPQAECLGAWMNNQGKLIEALRVEPCRWQTLLESSVKAYLDEHFGKAGGGNDGLANPDLGRKVQRFLGTSDVSFAPRTASSKEKPAGMSMVELRNNHAPSS